MSWPSSFGVAVLRDAVIESLHVSLSLPDSVKDTRLLDAIAKRLDAALATGKYDSMFGR